MLLIVWIPQIPNITASDDTAEWHRAHWLSFEEPLTLLYQWFVWGDYRDVLLTGCSAAELEIQADWRAECQSWWLYNVSGGGLRVEKLTTMAWKSPAQMWIIRAC